MCDQEHLIGYLYGELPAAEQGLFERHLTSCARCRAQLDGVGAARSHLAKWPVPAVALDCQLDPDRVATRPDRVATWPDQVAARVEVAAVAPAARGWSPAWGMAAAATLVVAAASAVANVEMTADGNGVRLRTGWSRAATTPSSDIPTGDGRATATTPGASPASSALGPVLPIPDLTAFETRLRELEARVGSQATATVDGGHAAPLLTSAPGETMTDSDVVRLVNRIVAERIAQSEDRQQAALGRRILQVNRDLEAVRRNDFDRLTRGLQQVDDKADTTLILQRSLQQEFLRTGIQR